MGPRVWRASRRASLDLERAKIIGIVNVTPDSFFDAARAPTPQDALNLACTMAGEGADMLDLGAESTRPGAARVSPDDQLARLTPCLKLIRAALPSMPICIDTTHASVADACLRLGADAINDVSAGLESPDLLPLVARHGAGLVLMHRLAAPDRDQFSDRYASEPRYTDVVATVKEFLAARAQAALAAGIPKDAIVIDPGLGFGKSVEQNLELLRRTDELLSLGFPILSAVSRKSFVGRVALGRDSNPGERLPGTLAFSMFHYWRGARLFRVHDVGEHRQTLQAIEQLGP